MLKIFSKVREVAEHVELDALIEKQVQFDRRVTQKDKWTKEQNVYGLSKNLFLQCASAECFNYWIAIVT